MNTRFAALGITLALTILLSASDVASAQEAASAKQDTAQAMQGMGIRHMGGMGAGMRQFMRGGHVGPMMLLGVKEELGLSEDQVTRLQKIHEDHRALMQAQMKQLAEHREAMKKARQANDWDALEKGITDGSNLRAGVARGLLNVEKQAFEVLSAEQRTKFETWQEGARVLGRQRMLHRRGMRDRGMMRGEGMRGMRMRLHRQPASPPPQS